MLLPVSIVFVGGGLGAIAREVSILLLHSYSDAFPLDIFVANVIASFVLGIVFARHKALRVSDNVLLLVGTGFAGGMSTFSTFIYGSYVEITTPGQIVPELFYVISSLAVGYSATCLGIGAATRIRQPVR
jgi:CrcB protein